MGRRTNDQNRVLMHAWYASTTAQAKAMWTMAISQHQFYLDKKDQEVSICLGTHSTKYICYCKPQIGSPTVVLPRFLPFAPIPGALIWEA